MKIGPYQIQGISTRFFVILGVVVFAPIIYLLFFHKGTPPPPLTNPAALNSERYGVPKQIDGALVPQDLASLPDNWITPYLRNSLRNSNIIPKQPTSFEELNSPGQSPDAFYNSAGAPYRFRVYIPTKDQDFAKGKPFSFNAEDASRRQLKKPNGDDVKIAITPAIFITPNLSGFDQASLDTDVTDEQSPQPILLATDASSALSPGRSYEITGILWWLADGNESSNFTQYQKEQQDSDTTIPPSLIFMVGNAQPVSSIELAAPARQYQPINLAYTEKLSSSGLEVKVQDVEWSAGAQVRACVIVRNTGSDQIDNWQGVISPETITGSFLANSGTEQPASADQTNISQAPPETLLPGGPPYSSYITFPETLANSSEPLVIRFPPLFKTNGPTGTAASEFSITTDPKKILTVGVDRRPPSCGDPGSIINTSATQ